MHRVFLCTKFFHAICYNFFCAQEFPCSEALIREEFFMHKVHTTSVFVHRYLYDRTNTRLLGKRQAKNASSVMEQRILCEYLRVTIIWCWVALFRRNIMRE